MSDLSVQFLFDFGSPNAYLCHKVIPTIERRTGVTFEYIPILLGGLFRLTGNRSPAQSLFGIDNKPEYERLEMDRFIARHGLSAFRHNPYSQVNTLHLMQGAVAARREGVFEKYVGSVFANMWEQGLKMDDMACAITALSSAGFDTNKLIATAQEADVTDDLLANTRSAFVRGAFGSPTFFVGDEIFFGKDRLRDVEEEILRVRTRQEDRNSLRIAV